MTVHEIELAIYVLYCLGEAFPVSCVLKTFYGLIIIYIVDLLILLEHKLMKWCGFVCHVIFMINLGTQRFQFLSLIQWCKRYQVYIRMLDAIYNFYTRYGLFYFCVDFNIVITLFNCFVIGIGWLMVWLIDWLIDFARAKYCTQIKINRQSSKVWCHWWVVSVVIVIFVLLLPMLRSNALIEQCLP